MYILPIFSFILTSQIFPANSQNLIINDTIYNPGIYKTSEEFEYSNLSVDFNFEIFTKKDYEFYSFQIDFRDDKIPGQVTYY